MHFKYKEVVALVIVTTVLTLTQETYGDADAEDNNMEDQPQQAVDEEEPDAQPDDVGEEEDTQPDENQQDGHTQEEGEPVDIMALNAELVEPEEDQEGAQELDQEADPDDYPVDEEEDQGGDPETDGAEPLNSENEPQQLSGSMQPGQNGKDCWLTLNGVGIFKALTDLDSKYAGIRKDYEKAVGAKMDKQMLDALLGTRGAAFRAIRNYGGNAREIPAGINLGGHNMMRQKDSLLFFHRMKLRNSTVFQVNSLHNDLMNMVLLADMGLNDLHLLGAYERTPTHSDPSVLFFRPTFGTLELLLKNVTYLMEARMRMMFDRIIVEVVNSELKTNDILMSFYNTNVTKSPDNTKQIEERDIEDFLERLKTDLDLWMKDYFNDYLMFYILPDADSSLFQESEKKKTLYLNEYANYAVNAIRQRIIDVGGSEVQLPKFTLFSVPDLVIRISDGVLRGLDTMHQRSVATAMRKGKLLNIDVVITFSRLKVEYTFEAILPDGSPPLTGSMFLTAEDVAAHMGITLVENQDITDLNFDFIQHMKPEFLVIEGPVNRLIANYQHLLENEILALMSNALVHNIKMLNTLPRCEPSLNSVNNVEEEELRRRNRRNKKRSKGRGRRQNMISPKHIKKGIKK